MHKAMLPQGPFEVSCHTMHNHTHTHEVHITCVVISMELSSKSKGVAIAAVYACVYIRVGLAPGMVVQQVS